jgi:predicted RNase H-like HicB family nuclease
MVRMKTDLVWHVTLLKHADGVSVSCPELPGCHSQGATEEEALANIREAIDEYVEIYGIPDIRYETRTLVSSG